VLEQKAPERMMTVACHFCGHCVALWAFEACKILQSNFGLLSRCAKRGADATTMGKDYTLDYDDRWKMADDYPSNIMPTTKNWAIAYAAALQAKELKLSDWLRSADILMEQDARLRAFQKQKGRPKPRYRKRAAR
jgi:hypothetical protein